MCVSDEILDAVEGDNMDFEIEDLGSDSGEHAPYAAMEIDGDEEDTNPSPIALWAELCEQDHSSCIDADFMAKIRLCSNQDDGGDASRRIPGVFLCFFVSAFGFSLIHLYCSCTRKRGKQAKCCRSVRRHFSAAGAQLHYREQAVSRARRCIAGSLDEGECFGVVFSCLIIF